VGIYHAGYHYFGCGLVLIIVGSASLYLMRQDMTIDDHQEYMEIYKQQQIMNERILDVQTFSGIGNS